MHASSKHKKNHHFLRPLVVLTTLLLAACAEKKPALDSSITEPRFLADHLSDLTEAQKIFATASLNKPTPLAISAGVKVYDEEVALLTNPSQWRAVDRTERFAAVVLTGSAASYKSLAEHLDGAPDWALTHLDHMGVVYRRMPVTAWKPDAAASIRERISALPAASRVAFLTGFAANLSARGFPNEARAAVDEALEVEPGNAQALVLQGGFAMASKDFLSATRHARTALETSPHYAPALYLLTESLLASGSASEAFDAGENLLATGGDRAANLFLFAKAARAVHHYRKESEALAELIALADASGVPTASYRVFYGQALASDGKPVEALEQFETAIRSGALNRGELDFAANSALRLREKLGIE